jgi:hypothetical protein
LALNCFCRKLKTLPACSPSRWGAAAFEPSILDERIKGRKPDGFEKEFKLRRANLVGVRRAYARRSDFEMQCNAEIGLFTELSILGSR